MLRLRLAQPDDAPLLREWDTRPHLQLSSDPDEDWGWEEGLRTNPDWRDWWMAELDGRPIGFLQIMNPSLDTEYQYWGADAGRDLRAIDIWIGEAELLGQGHGTRMMELALERCFAEEEVEAVLVDPLATNTRGHRFYERCGFKFLERRTFNSDACFVYQITRAEWRKGGA